jgi:glycosyltransferase 2 family protein
MKRPTMGVVVRVLLSVALLVVLLMLIDRQALLQAFVEMDGRLFLIGLGVYALSVGVWSFRWLLIISVAGETVGYVRVFLTTLVGLFFSQFLPAMVGTDIARMVELSDEAGTNARVVSTVLLDRLIGLVSLVIMALVALVFSYGIVGVQDSRIAFITIGAFVALIVGWLVFFNRGLMRRFNWVFQLPFAKRTETSIRNLYESLHHLQNQPRLLLSALAVSFVMQIIEIGSIVFIAQALNIQIPIVDFFIFVPLIWIVTTIPISISGLGLREGAFAVFFAQVGVSSSDAVALSLLYYAYHLVLGIAGGLVFLRSSLKRYAAPQS